MELTLRGITYTLETIRDTQIAPLTPLFGTPPFPDEDSPEFKSWSEKVMMSILIDPVKQGIFAYVLINLFPDLDPSIARYRVQREGQEYHPVGFLSIDADEFAELLLCISPLMEAKKQARDAASKKAIPPKPEPDRISGKGFAKQALEPTKTEGADDPTERDADTASDRIKALEAELEELRAIKV